MESQLVLRLYNYLDFIPLRMWLIVGSPLFGITCGLIFYLSQDKVYKSEAILTYQHLVTPSQASPDNQNDLGEMVKTVTPRVVSRSSLINIVREENLYPDLLEDLSIERVVEIMRNDIATFPSITSNSLMVEYIGKDSASVVRVTNNLANKYVEESRNYRQERLAELITSKKDDLELTKRLLDQKEAEMRDYAFKYYNEMPDQQKINRTRLAVLQDQYR